MKQILFVIVGAFFISCSSMEPRGFTYHFDGKYTGLDTLIDIEGYYYFKTECESKSTVEQMIMFYPNGLLLIAYAEIPEEISFCFEDNDKVDKCQFSSWGVYQIFGDTITIQKIVNYGPLYGTKLFCQEFKILDNKEIINVANYHKSEHNNRGCGDYKENTCPTIAKFRKLESKRDYQDCPWLEKKWFYSKEMARSK